MTRPDPAEVTAFIRARAADDLAGPGAARAFRDPTGSPCPIDGCGIGIPITGYQVLDHGDHVRYLLVHAFNGGRCEHPITEDRFFRITEGGHTEAALAVQDHIAAILAVVDAFEDVVINGGEGEFRLAEAFELLAGTWRRHPDYPAGLREDAPAGDNPTYVDSRDTSHQQDHPPRGGQSTP